MPTIATRMMIGSRSGRRRFGSVIDDHLASLPLDRSSMVGSSDLKVHFSALLGIPVKTTVSTVTSHGLCDKNRHQIYF
jgi:hypothetical protein